jgi:hypothetical protein
MGKNSDFGEMMREKGKGRMGAIFNKVSQR